MIFDKQIKEYYKKTLMNRHDPDGSVYYFSHTDFEGLSAQPYSFTTPAGDTLRGNLYSYPGFREDRLVVFDHGMGAGHNAYMREIEVMCRHGYRVLAYDHTGCNKSDGTGIRGLSGSLYDLDACLNSVAADSELGSLDIYVVGHSWGAFSSMNISAYHPEIKAVVAISGFYSVSEMLRQVFPPLLAPWRPAALAAEQEMNPDHFSASAIENLRNTPTRVLFIHSKDDAVASYNSHFSKLSEALSGNPSITLLAVEGKGHNPNFTSEAVKYKDAFLAELTKLRKKKQLVSDQQKSEFVSSYDWYKMTEQDIELWQIIFDFLDK